MMSGTQGTPVSTRVSAGEGTPPIQWKPPMPVPHQITVSSRNGVDAYVHAGTGITVAHPADALARLCRRLVALGATGLAEVRGADGRLRFTVRAVERLAKLTLAENDGDGLRWRRHAPSPMAAEAA